MEQLWLLPYPKLSRPGAQEQPVNFAKYTQNAEWRLYAGDALLIDIDNKFNNVNENMGDALPGDGEGIMFLLIIINCYQLVFGFSLWGFLFF
jgi:hypothetical protein